MIYSRRSQLQNPQIVLFAYIFLHVLAQYVYVGISEVVREVVWHPKYYMRWHVF